MCSHLGDRLSLHLGVQYVGQSQFLDFTVLWWEFLYPINPSRFVWIIDNYNSFVYEIERVLTCFTAPCPNIYRCGTLLASTYSTVYQFDQPGRREGLMTKRALQLV